MKPPKSPDRPAAGWLLLIHQLPPKPAYLRVKIWRRLQGVGAVAIKNSVYALPSGEQTQEDFQWLLKEIVEGGGDGSICAARFVEGLSDAQLRGMFDAARDADYDAIAGEAGALAEAGASADEVAARLVRLRRRFAEVGAIDFFGAGGRETVEGLLSGLEARLREAAGAAAPTAGEGECFDRSPGRTWVTRARVGIDRMASAWLIRRFIDPKARFKFVAAAGYRPRGGEVRFDMFEAEYTHVGDRCTFEVLVERAGLSDLGLRRIGEIVHDVDIKDDKFGRPETPGIAQVVAGIAAAHASDEARLERAFALFDDLLATTGAKRPRRAAARRRAR